MPMSRLAVLALLTALLAAAGCSDAPARSGRPEERGKGMSEDIWKAYSGTESGVSEREAPEKKK